LQGPNPRRGLGDGRPDPGHDRFVRWHPRVVDDGQRDEHHRGLRLGARRLARVRDLEIRRRAPAPRRTTLHDGVGDPRGDVHDREVARMATTPTPAPGAMSGDDADTLSLARWTVTSGSNSNSRGAVVIAAGDHQWEASAEGNGAVDALFRAV